MSFEYDDMRDSCQIIWRFWIKGDLNINNHFEGIGDTLGDDDSEQRCRRIDYPRDEFDCWCIALHVRRMQ